MTGNPMEYFSANVDAWGPLEWFDRLAKATHDRSRSVRDKDDIAFETYKNIASSSATRLVSDFEDKVRMALTTLRELEKANVAYVDANTALISENERLKQDRYDLAYAITGGEDAPGLLDSVPTTQLVEIARDTHRSHSADIDRAMAAEAEVKRLRSGIKWCIDRDKRNGSLPGSYAEKLQALASTGGDPLKAFDALVEGPSFTEMASTGGEHHGN